MLVSEQEILELKKFVSELNSIGKKHGNCCKEELEWIFLSKENCT